MIVKLIKFFAALFFLIFWPTAHCANEIMYKEIKFGTKEHEFIAKLKDENFICDFRDKRKVSKTCQSKSVTYGDIKAKSATAFFYNNSFYRIIIDIADTENLNFENVNSTKNHLISIIKDKYNYKIQKNVSTQNINKKLSITETYVMTDNMGQELKIQFFKIDDFCILELIISNLDAVKKTNEEHKKERLSNM